MISFFINRPARLLAVLLTGLVVAPGPKRVLAQSLTWNDISGRLGFSVLTGLSDGTLFARYDFILYRSTDDGETWINFPRPGGPILEFVTRGSTALLVVGRYNAADYKQYFISTDRAENWSRIYTEGSGGTVHTNIMLSADETVYGLYPRGSKMGFEKFVDGVWQQVGNPPQVYYVQAAPRTYTVSDIDASGNLYIGTVVDGIHSSRDDGQTWNRPLSYRYVSAIAFGPDGRVAIGTLPNGRTAGGVFISDDHGASWTLYDLTDVYIRGIRIDPRGDIFVVSDEGIYRRRVGAPEWETVGPFDFTYSVLEITASDKYIATAEGYGLLVSTDAGETWTSDGVRSQELYSIASTPDGTMLAGTLGRGYFRSTDRGAIWDQYRRPGDPEYYYCLVRSDQRVFAGTEKGLYVTDDNGAGWTPLATAAADDDGVPLSVYAFATSAAGDYYIGTAAGIWRSGDGGMSWSEAGLGTSAVRALAPDDADRLYVATVSEGVFLSTNRGTSWVSRGLVRPDLQTVAVNDAGVVYAGVAGGIYYSTDGGINWTSKFFTYGHVYAFLFNGNFDTYAATSWGLFGSSDGGQSWGSRGLESQFVIALDYDLDHSMIAAVYRGGVYRTFQVITAAEETGELPRRPSLSQNYPNPFNPLTTISYDVPAFSEVTLEVFDMLGRTVATLVSGSVPPGHHMTHWDASDFPSGVYVYRIRISPSGTSSGSGAAGPFGGSGKMLLVR